MSEQAAIIAFARAWWEAKMPNSQFVSARIRGDGRVDVNWSDKDEDGTYTLPVDFIAAVQPNPGGHEQVTQRDREAREVVEEEIARWLYDLALCDDTLMNVMDLVRRIQRKEHRPFEVQQAIRNLK